MNQKLKRYDLDCSTQLGICEMEEHPQGDYVKFPDIVPLIEGLKKLETIHFDWLRHTFDLPEIRNIIREALEKSGVGMNPENRKVQP